MPEEIQSAEDQQQPERPEWLDPRFKSEADQAQAYPEARKEMDRMRSQMETERAQYTAALEAIEQRALQTPPAQPASDSFDPLVAQYEQAYQTGDVAAMLRISADAAAQRVIEPVTKAIDERLSEFRPALETTQLAQRESQIRMAEDLVRRDITAERYQELYPEIKTIVERNPAYLPSSGTVEQYAEAIRNVAKLAEHDHLRKSVASLEQERAEKLQAQPVPAAASRPSSLSPDQQKQEWDRIKNAPNDSYATLMNRQ